MKLKMLSAVLLVVSTTAAMAQTTAPAYRYSGTHAGGPADALIPNGEAQPVQKHETSEAYRYSGPHAGGPADALIPNVTPQTVEPQFTAPGYRYSGPHAGGPAKDMSRN